MSFLFLVSQITQDPDGLMAYCKSHGMEEEPWTKDQMLRFEQRGMDFPATILLWKRHGK